MGLSVSDAVVEIMEGMHFLKPAMKLDLVNYSALARVIKPRVEKRLGEKVELEAVIMAIRRNAHVFVKKTPATVFDVLKQSKVDLITGMCFVKLRRSPAVSEQLMEFIKNVNAEQMQNIYVTHRIDEIAVFMPEQLLTKMKLVPIIKRNPSVLKKTQCELAIITVHLPQISVEVPGVIAIITNCLADRGISVLTITGSFERTALVLNENDAPAAYEHIHTLIRESRETDKTRAEQKTAAH